MHPLYNSLPSLNTSFPIHGRILPNTSDRNAAFLNNDNRRSKLNNDPCNFFVQPTTELNVEVWAGLITYSCKDVVASPSEVILVFIKGWKMPSTPCRTGILAQNYKRERKMDLGLLKHICSFWLAFQIKIQWQAIKFLLRLIL